MSHFKNENIPLQMRTYKCKTEHGRYSRDIVEVATEAVVNGGLSIRQSARNNKVKNKTLSRYCYGHTVGHGSYALVTGVHL